MRQKGAKIYEGKAKILYDVVGQKEEVWVEFKDSLTAFNAQKVSSFSGKGELNAKITSNIYKRLMDAGIETHWIEDVDSKNMICRKVRIAPLEVVVRNRLAGSTAKRLGFQEGHKISAPLVEFYYKDDGLGDPFVSDDQALLLGAVQNASELEQLKKQARAIDEVLIRIFAEAGLELIDFKLEFGRDGEGKFILADEISPDTCRLWDQKTGEKLDKDRFRRDLGNVAEAYHEVWERLSGERG